MVIANTKTLGSGAFSGFIDISIEPTRVYEMSEAKELLVGQGVDVAAMAPCAQGKFMSAFIRASKPARG